MPVNSGDNLPLSWSTQRELHAGDLVAMATGFLFHAGPFYGTGCALNALIFHFPAHAPVRDQPGGCLFLLLWFAIGIPLALVGKYVWLLAMSRVLSRAEVAPWIAYGIPRRLSRLDATILRRFYNR